MYEKHFSFKHKPFELVPDPDFLFLSSTHKKAITYLDYGIKEKIGFILITGEIGSGKTTVIRTLLKNLDKNVTLSRINNTKVSSEQLIAMINEDFRLDIEGKGKARLLGDLNDFLIDQYAREVQSVLLIDEAQNLSPELLEEVRLLSNLETDKAKLLRIILVGQPELKTTLMRPELKQLRQRININYHISALSPEETLQYIEHRLRVAGNAAAMSLSKEILDVIYTFSRGIPRLINIVCDFALLAAFVDGKVQVDIDSVKDVVQDLDGNNYWRDSGTEDITGRDEYNDNNMPNDLALRVLKIEEILKNNVSMLSTVRTDLRDLFGQLSTLKDSKEAIESTDSIDDKNKVQVEIAELSSILKQIEERLSEVEIGRSLHDHTHDKGRDEELSRHIGALNSKLNYLNGKINSTESS
ncbi:MAG: AAA family ATPase [Nitrospira sp.]|nr:AAA family ATPase [Candidatus Brocadiales bacterium]MBL7048836.1 AAA family ATPase [Nitrospira sp.]